jgi:hypothetical protein
LIIRPEVTPVRAFGTSLPAGRSHAIAISRTQDALQVRPACSYRRRMAARTSAVR